MSHVCRRQPLRSLSCFISVLPFPILASLFPPPNSRNAPSIHHFSCLQMCVQYATPRHVVLQCAVSKCPASHQAVRPLPFLPNGPPLSLSLPPRPAPPTTHTQSYPPRRPSNSSTFIPNSVRSSPYPFHTPLSPTPTTSPPPPAPSSLTSTYSCPSPPPYFTHHTSLATNLSPTVPQPSTLSPVPPPQSPQPYPPPDPFSNIFPSSPILTPARPPSNAYLQSAYPSLSPHVPSQGGEGRDMQRGGPYIPPPGWSGQLQGERAMGQLPEEGSRGFQWSLSSGNVMSPREQGSLRSGREGGVGGMGRDVDPFAGLMR